VFFIFALNASLGYSNLEDRFKVIAKMAADAQQLESTCRSAIFAN